MFLSGINPSLLLYKHPLNSNIGLPSTLNKHLFSGGQGLVLIRSGGIQSCIWMHPVYCNRCCIIKIGRMTQRWPDLEKQ